MRLINFSCISLLNLNTIILKHPMHLPKIYHYSLYCKNNL